jgi:uncharacterized protein YndB with AHSA1/START domain
VTLLAATTDRKEIPMARTIEHTITVDAPPETVFRALTDAGELERWFPTGAESDARPGGAYRYQFEFEQDTSRNHTYSGTYTAFEAPVRVAYDWPTEDGMTSVEFRVAPSGDGSEVALLHTGWDAHSDDGVEEFRQGWGFFLSNLEGYLERGEDARASQMGMKTAARA